MPGWRARNLWLFAASLVFYSFGEAHYVLVLLVSISLNAWLGRRIERSDNGRKYWLWLAIGANLLILGYYKYAGFLVEAITPLAGIIGLGQPESVDVHLPLGISFFTFQAISYIVDVYRREVPAQKSWLEVGLYISLFPQLIAGPIVRYNDIADQLRQRHADIDDFAWGVRRFMLGLAKKVLIANILGQVADEIFAHDASALDWSVAWLGIICYTLQIYFDFSGYSDMAIGLGRLFGFRFPENFNHPYISRSVREFWRRWHISLSRWFRDYLYIPLGGSRLGTRRTAFNLLIVFALCGLWHGAAWNFLIWGLFHGAFLALERGRLGAVLARLPVVLQHVYLLGIVIIGWVLFRAETLTEAIDYLGIMFGIGGVDADGYVMMYLNNQVLLALLAGIVLSATPRWTTITETHDIKRDKLTLPATNVSIENNNVIVESSQISHRRLGIIVRDSVLLASFVLSAIYVSAQSYNPFIYFRF